MAASQIHQLDIDDPIIIWKSWAEARETQDYEGYFQFARQMAIKTNTTCGGRRHSEKTVVSCPWPGSLDLDTLPAAQKMFKDLRHLGAEPRFLAFFGLVGNCRHLQFNQELQANHTFFVREQIKDMSCILLPPLEAYFITSAPAEEKKCPLGWYYKDLCHRCQYPLEYFLVVTWREMHRPPSVGTVQQMRCVVKSCIDLMDTSMDSGGSRGLSHQKKFNFQGTPEGLQERQRPGSRRLDPKAPQRTSRDP